MPLEELAWILRDLGGTPEEILADDGLLERMQGLLAADFAVNERYTYRPDPPLGIPIKAFGGRDDAAVELPQLARVETILDLRLPT